MPFLNVLISTQLFAGDVNSPLKPLAQNQNKDANSPANLNGRKTSVSQSATHGLASPASSRPGTRRRDTSDNPFSTGLTSPLGAGRFNRDEASPFFARKDNESRENADDKEEPRLGLRLGSFARNPVNSSLAGSTGWGTNSPGAAMSPMGTFGNFAIGGASIPPTPLDRKGPFGATRGESRLAHLMPKDTTEEPAPSSRATSWRSRPRTDTDPYGDDAAAGNNAQENGRDSSPSHRQQISNFETPARGATDHMGMSDVPRFRDVHAGHLQQTPAHRNGQEAQSPSDTNPYRSPPDERGANEESLRAYGVDDHFHQQERNQALAGLPDQGPSAFNNAGRIHPGAPFDGSDRSQTSSVGGNRGMQAIGGLPALNIGSLSGWPTSGNTMGTPDRESRPAFPGPFGNSIFGTMGDLQSPSLASASGVLGAGQIGTLGAGNLTARGSKLGSLFPAAMQAQMQPADHEHPGESLEPRQSLGTIGRGAFPSMRDVEFPARSNRHPFEDIFPTSERPGAYSSAGPLEGQSAFANIGQANPSQAGQGHAQSEAANTLPTAQQRMMVMPDRMAWVYLDPQGQVQGPWSGLEMHDWYKASFFTADLSVKKLEDAEFEPLGQLIRRIGNSREPFLVPQIGIPHNFPANQSTSSFPASSTIPNSAAPLGAVQPPFAGAFPSFGTTLTAEQQNNLERRKQEEQYLMARQREFLAQQQVNMKQMQMSGMPGVLHHHSSAHSLHSQPSFGSMTSPIGMPPQASLGGMQGFLDGAMRQAQMAAQMPPPSQPSTTVPQDAFNEDAMARMALQERLMGTSQQTTGTMLGQQDFPSRDVDGEGDSEQGDPMGFQAKLKEFHVLRALDPQDDEAAKAQEQLFPNQRGQAAASQVSSEARSNEPAKSTLSLTQQVQQAATAKDLQDATSSQPESPWAKVDTGLPMPFPPPQSTTPLPAPTAQRGRSTLPETLNAGSRSRSETPDAAAAPPTLAPWAKETAEASKGISLKEIQAAEARKAAIAEEIASAQRRQIQEQELKMMANQATAPAPGLPTTSTWGSTGSPAGTPTPSAWAKSSPTKAPTLSSASAKKTLADIQREEEKRKAKETAQSTTVLPSNVTGGKRYAELASKTAAAPATLAGPAWSTVGAGGKVKTPVGTTTGATPSYRSASGAPTPFVGAARTSRPAAPSRPAANGQSANDEFTKWAKGALAKGLNTGINGAYFDA